MHRFQIPGMTCSVCFGAVTRALQALDPRARVEGNLETRWVEVVSEETEQALLDALRKAGYPAQTTRLPA